jgi:hypothetical protein
MPGARIRETGAAWESRLWANRPQLPGKFNNQYIWERACTDCFTQLDAFWTACIWQPLSTIPLQQPQATSSTEMDIAPGGRLIRVMNFNLNLRLSCNLLKSSLQPSAMSVSVEEAARGCCKGIVEREGAAKVLWREAAAKAIWIEAAAKANVGGRRKSQSQEAAAKVNIGAL